MSGDDVHSDASVPEPSSRRSDSDEEPEPDALDGRYLALLEQRPNGPLFVPNGPLFVIHRQELLSKSGACKRQFVGFKVRKAFAYPARKSSYYALTLTDNRNTSICKCRDAGQWYRRGIGRRVIVVSGRGE